MLDGGKGWGNIKDVMLREMFYPAAPEDLPAPKSFEDG